METGKLFKMKVRQKDITQIKSRPDEEKQYYFEKGPQEPENSQ